ncbi:MAG TPA: SRPBCC domain-containing protein [Saprospiraceae bacterium]|nr:SRPBCC domain-containing protein [Saprospiraceae bacterium]
MAEYDWSQFTVRVPINATIEKLYDAWSTRRGIEHWFLRKSEYKSSDGTLRTDDEKVQKGDTYAWLWHGWPDEVEEHGEILDCNGKDHFKFTFGDAGICAVDLKIENGQMILELTQFKIPTDEHGKQYWHVGCKTGWTFHLTNMKSIFEGGQDLRNKDVDIKNVINA